MELVWLANNLLSQPSRMQPPDVMKFVRSQNSYQTSTLAHDSPICSQYNRRSQERMRYKGFLV